MALPDMNFFRRQIRSARRRATMAVGRRIFPALMKYMGVPESRLANWSQWWKEKFGSYGHPFATHTHFFRGVTFISDAIASMPIVIAKKQGDDVVPILSGIEWQALNRPSVDMSGRDLQSQIAGHLQMRCGECFVVIVSEGKARVLVVVPGTWVRINYGPGGVRTYTITGFMGGEKTIEEREIIHFKRGFNPVDPTRGIGPLAAAQLVFEDDMDISAHNRAVVKNGGIKPLLIGTDQPLPEDPELDRVKAELEDLRGDLESRGKVGFLGWGMKWQDVSMTPQEMDFVEKSKMNRGDMGVALGLPPAKLGDYQRDQADAEVQERDAWNDTIIPLGATIANTWQLNLWKITGRSMAVDEGWFVFFDHSKVPCMVRQEEELHAGQRADVQEGILTRDEVRKARGLKPIPGGNIATVAFGLVPLTTVSTSPLLTPAPAPTPTEDDAPKSGGITITKVARRWKQSRTPQGDEIMWLGFTFNAYPLEAQMKAEIIPVWNEVEREVIANIRQLPGTRAFRATRGGVALGEIEKEVARDLLFDINRIARKIAAGTTPTIRMAQLKGGKRGMELIDKSPAQFRLDAAPAIEQLHMHIQRFAVPITKTTWEALNAGLEAGLKEGVPSKELEDIVMEIMGVRRSDAARTARTEVSAALNGGIDAAFDQSTVVLTKEWITAGDEHVREAHEHANGQEVPTNQNFLVGGEHLRYPGDPHGSAGNVIECRCSLLPGQIA